MNVNAPTLKIDGALPHSGLRIDFSDLILSIHAKLGLYSAIFNECFCALMLDRLQLLYIPLENL